MRKGPLLLKGVLLIAAIAGLSGGWVVYDTQRYKAFHDPQNVPDIAGYQEHYGTPERIYLKRIGGEEYYGLVPPRGDFKVFVSGPPVFLYDQTGKLWDYTLNGGDESFARGKFSLDRWDGVVENPQRTIQSLLRQAAEAGHGDAQ